MKRVVIDTNVLYSALRSDQGASHKLLLLLAEDSYQAHLTVPLFLEYQEQTCRLVDDGVVSKAQADDILDYICTAMDLVEVYFLWRPFLKDIDNDMVLEAAVAGQCSCIITHNVRDFKGIDLFDLTALTPGQFLKELEERQ